jgi:hypothetical protein
MMSFLLVANIGRRDFGWFFSGVVWFAWALWRWFGGLSHVANAVYRRWVFFPPPLSLPLPFLLFPFFPHLCVRCERFSVLRFCTSDSTVKKPHSSHNLTRVKTSHSTKCPPAAPLAPLNGRTPPLEAAAVAASAVPPAPGRPRDSRMGRSSRSRNPTPHAFTPFPIPPNLSPSPNPELAKTMNL